MGGITSEYHRVKRLLLGGLLTVLLVPNAGAGAVPSLQVTVAAGGVKPSFRSLTRANGTFTTGNLSPGHYVVQLNSKSPALKGDHYLVIVLAGRKTFVSNALPGENFLAGGIAVNVDLRAPGKIVGQVASARELENANVRMIDGKRYFWVVETGSNLGGRWRQEGAVSSQNLARLNESDIRAIQQRAGEGSLQGNMHRTDLELGNGHH